MSTTTSIGSPAPSLTSLAASGGHDSRAHSVQFYEDDAFLLDEVSRFIGSALGAGDAGIVIATRAHRAGLARLLTARGLDTALAMAQGRYIALDAAETLATFMRDGWPDATRFANEVGGVIVRATEAATGERLHAAIFGEMVSLLWAQGRHEAALQLEHLWNGLARGHAFHLHCAYPLSVFRQADDGARMEQVCAVHSGVIPAESYTSLLTDKERLRAITLLQQKAQALEIEVEERKSAEQALQERNQQLREAVAARDVFLSVAAHELKTPVTGLRGFAQLLLRDMQRKGEIAPERLASALSTIDVQSKKLHQLVERLLDTAQIEAGKLRIEPISTDLIALVHAVLAQYQDSASHALVVAGPTRLDARVDPVRFEQVITNLLDNAITFSPQGGSVMVELGQGDDGVIRLTVSDEGMGLASDQREAAFERFHQAHSAGHLSGLGLGLYITREIVELHGGSVRIEQPEHRGTRVVVTLPPAAVSDAQIETDSAP